MFLNYPGFPAGEISESFAGRTDIAALKQGCILARNVIDTKSGGLFQRPGFGYKGLAGSQSPGSRVRLFPFVAAPDAAYIVEADDGYFRFWRNGSLVLTTAEALTKPNVISGLGDPLAVGGPFSGETVFQIQFCQANDVAWIAHEGSPVFKLFRFAVDGFYGEEMTFIFPPMRDENTEEITLQASATTGTGITLTAVGGDVFTADNVGGYFSLTHRRNNPSIELSLSNGSGTAGAALVFAGQPTAGETVSVGKPGATRVYAWFAAVPLAPYGVLIGTTAAEAAENFKDAINGPPNGTTVGYGTIKHPDVESESVETVATNTAASGVLSFVDNDVTNGTPDEFIINGQTYAFTDDATTGPAYRVKRDPTTLATTIQNAILAINGTGAAGVNYTAGTVANPDVTADPTVPTGNSLRIVAPAGAAGNAITTEVDHTSRLSWGATTLTGGADGSTQRVSVTARVSGVAGNDIVVSENSTNVEWQPTPNFVGGADTVTPDPSETLTVNGQWEVTTLGRWYGTLVLEQQRSTGEWEAVRTWTSQNDFNTNSTGTTNGPTLMRLVYTGSGEDDDNAPARATLTALDASITGLVLITGYTSPTVATGDVIRDLWSTDPTYEWAEGAWSERRGYPSAVVLHQQRLVFGQDADVYGSQTGGFDNFERNGLADASYKYSLAAVQQSDIVALQSQRGLIILTEVDEWLMDGGSEGAAITPLAIRTERLTRYGSTSAMSEVINASIVYIQRGENVLNEYLFAFERQNYEAVDLSELVDHLGDERIKQIAWAPVPHPLIWSVTRAGSLLSMTYRRASGMIAWTKHVSPDVAGRDAIFESVAVIPGDTNGTSQVWVVVTRGTGGGFVRTVEATDVSYWESLQAAETVDLRCTDGSISAPVIGPGTPVVTGLGHLEGREVQILVGGAIHDARTVSGGEITLDLTGFAVGVYNAIVGLAPVVLIQPMPADVQLQDGSSDGRKWRVAKINAKFFRTGACESSDGMDAKFYTVPFRSGADLTDTPVPLFTGMRKIENAGRHLYDTTITLRNQTALPLNLLSITIEAAVTGAE